MVCPTTKIINPCTNRCVKKDSKTGKAVIARKKRLDKKTKSRKIRNRSRDRDRNRSRDRDRNRSRDRDRDRGRSKDRDEEKDENIISTIQKKTIYVNGFPFRIAQNEYPLTVDMSYYISGIENLLVIHRFNENGQLIPKTPESISEEYFRNLYIQFVSNYGTELFERYKGMKLLRNLDSGVFGNIYSIKYQDRVMIIKMEMMKSMFTLEQFKRKINKELHIQTLLSTKAENHALMALDTYIFRYLSKTLSVILMERLDPVRQYILHDILQIRFIPPRFFKILKNQLRTIINILCTLDIIHGDMHWNNVYLTYLGSLSRIIDISNWREGDIKFGLIDFGYSTISPCNPEIEFLALLRSTYNSAYSSSTKKNLMKIIYELMDERKIERRSLHNFFDIHNRYMELFQKNILYNI